MLEYKGCLLWGARVVIPESLRSKTLKLLHANHPGIRVTKALARSHVWWPNIDKYIEQMVKNCRKCIEVQAAPPRTAIELWKPPSIPWTRLHLDFAGPFEEQTFLIIVDAATKWLEIRRVPSPSTSAVIKELRKLIVTFGIPETIVSDSIHIGRNQTLVQKKMESHTSIQHPTTLKQMDMQKGWCKPQKTD